MAPKMQFERDFSPVFTHEMYGSYFAHEIERRGWNFPTYNHPSVFALPELVTLFYESMEDRSLDDLGYIKLNWGDRVIHIDRDMIHEVTLIPRLPAHDHPLHFEDYMPLMGNDCAREPRKGIQARTLFTNVFTVCRWAQNNIFGSSHNTTFFTPSLHVVHTLMTKNPRFDMCTVLLHSLGAAKRGTIYPCPMLVTQLCCYFLPAEEFDYYMIGGVPVRPLVEGVTSSYSRLTEIWSRTEPAENVPAQTPSSSSTSSEGEMTPQEHARLMRRTMRGINSLRDEFRATTREHDHRLTEIERGIQTLLAKGE